VFSRVIHRTAGNTHKTAQRRVVHDGTACLLRIWINSYFMQVEDTAKIDPLTRSNFLRMHPRAPRSGSVRLRCECRVQVAKSDTVCSTMAFHLHSSRHIAGMAMALWPPATRLLGGRASRSYVDIRQYHCSALRSERLGPQLKPMPEAAPVTSATLSLKDKFI